MPDGVGPNPCFSLLALACILSSEVPWKPPSSFKPLRPFLTLVLVDEDYLFLALTTSSVLL